MSRLGSFDARRFRSVALAGLLGFSLVLLGCPQGPAGPSPESSAAKAKRASVVLVVLDTLRADDAMRGPTLRGLAATGASFTQAYAHTATTAPSHATLFTSRFPSTHGVRKNVMPLSPKFVSLAETLGEAGYQTAAFVSALPMHAGWGLLQGFEYVDDRLWAQKGKREGRPCTKSKAERCGEEVILAVHYWLTEVLDRSRPFFLFVHLYDPHGAYEAPGPFFRPRPERGTWMERCRGNRSAYRGEVAYADHLVGELLGDLQEARADENTLLVLTADHGEAFGEHRNCAHAGNLYEELVRIPLLFSWPGKIAARTDIDQPVGIIDLAPTILELLEVSAEPMKPVGTSLAGLLSGSTEGDPEAPVFFERAFFPKPMVVHRREWHGSQVGVRSGKWKYTRSPLEGTTQLFDLEADPGEVRNLADRHPEVTDRLSSLVTIWERESKVGPEGPPPPPVDEDVGELLRELGYIP